MITVMSCWLAGAAYAVPVQFSDTFNPSDVKFLKDGGGCSGNNNSNDTVSNTANGGCELLTYTHSLSNFNPSTDTLTSATLSLTFYDDFDANSEKFDIDLGGVDFRNNVQITNLSVWFLPFGVEYNVLASINSNGELAVTLMRGNNGSNNDFYFASSMLDASGTRTDSVAQTPEPGTWLLLGTGLVGMLGYGWRRKQQQTV
jgi:hypothetical protein